MAVRQCRKTHDHQDGQLPSQKAFSRKPPAEEDHVDQNIRENDKEGDAVLSNDIGYLNQFEVSILGVYKEAPGKTGQYVGPDIFETDPNPGRNKRRKTRTSQKTNQVRKKSRKKGQIKTEDNQHREAYKKVQTAIILKGDNDPVNQGHVVCEPRNEP